MSDAGGDAPAGWIVRRLGRRPHAAVERAMREFTESRGDATPDELWLVEHEPVFTLGVAGRDAHVLDAGGVPVARTNRGGQVTYHGPGQAIAYPLVDLGRLGLHAREYVHRLEEAAIRTLADVGVTGHRVAGAPGVYVRLGDPFGHAVQPRAAPDDPRRFDGLAKIAALGVKIARRGAYHGLALNVAMDLAPFARIDPCGHPGLATTDLASLGVDAGLDAVAGQLALRLAAQLQPR